MSKDQQDPADVLQQFIEKNKDAISQVSFGGGTKNKACQSFATTNK